MNLQEQLGPGWYELLGPLFAEDWMETLGKRIEAVKELGDGMLQPGEQDVFRAYRTVQPSQLKVLILGQDPYPNGQADGFAFSTKEALPPKTLRIVFRELERTGYGRRHNPNLSDWAEQGVMLLNTILTCTYRQTLSHKGWGWEKFIAATLDHINDLAQPFVVMCWGTHARELVQAHVFDGETAKGYYSNRLILKSCHPVAESYSNGAIRFTGCNHFQDANQFLMRNGLEPIEWVYKAHPIITMGHDLSNRQSAEE